MNWFKSCKTKKAQRILKRGTKRINKNLKLTNGSKDLLLKFCIFWYAKIIKILFRIKWFVNSADIH